LAKSYKALELDTYMELKKAEIKHIADLARLKISDKDLDFYAGELSAVLGYVEKLNEVDAQKVELASNISNLNSVYRKDETSPKQRTGVAKNVINLAPFVKNRFVKVKNVFKK